MFQTKVRTEGRETRNHNSTIGVNGTPEFEICGRHSRKCQQNYKKPNDGGAYAQNTETKRNIEAKLFLPIKMESTKDIKGQYKNKYIRGEV